MRKNLAMALLVFVSIHFSGCYFLIGSSLSLAQTFGAKAKLDLAVVDDEGMPVKSADVYAAFTRFGYESSNVAKGKTDEEGKCSLSDICVGEVIIGSKEKGYYETRRTFWLDDEVCFGMWQPYGRKERLLLKPIRNPVAEAGVLFNAVFKKNIRVLGFDLEAADFVAPHGTGRITDIIVSFSPHPDSDVDGICSISFPNTFDGAYLMQKDECSSFPYAYHADTNAVYQAEYRADTRLDGSLINENQYLIIRSRAKSDQNGKLKEAFYSRIEGPFRMNLYGATFNYHFNPKVNSTNLEFDPNVINRCERRVLE